MAHVAVTGAAGSVGRVTVDALADDHDLAQITHREREGIDSTVLDVEDLEALREALAGADAVVHLAADPSPDAPWESILPANVEGTYSLYEAARANGLERVVFASTNHVDQMYNIDDPSRPETLREGARAVSPEDPPRPDSYYAVSKVFGEAMGSYYADRHGLEVVNLRIGWLLTREELRGLQAGEESVARYARAMWLSPRDCGQAMRRAVGAELPENPLTVNLTSANHERYLSLAHTMRSLGYEPADNSAEAV